MLLSIQHIVLQKPRLSQNQCNDVGGRWSWTCGCNASVFVWAASWKHCLNGSSHKTTCWATLMICVPYEEGIEYILIFCTYFFFGVLHKSFGRAFSSSRDTSETFECRWPWCSSVYLNDVFFLEAVWSRTSTTPHLKTYVSTARGGNLQKWEGTLCQRGHVHSHSIHCSDLPPFPMIDQIPTQQPNFIEFPHLALQVPVGTKEAACGYGAVASTSGFARKLVCILLSSAHIWVILF